MEGSDKVDNKVVQEAAAEPHTMESCLKRVRRLFEHEGENVEHSWVDHEAREMARVLFEGPYPPLTEAQEANETVAINSSGTKFPVVISDHVLTKTYEAKFVNEDRHEFVINFGRRQQKDAQHKAEQRQWNYNHFLGRERRMLHPEEFQPLEEIRVFAEVGVKEVSGDERK